jgi:MFS family permease
MAAQGARRYLTISYILAVLLFWASLYMYVPILPIHARRLGADDAMIGVIVGSYGLAQLILRIPLGAISDRLGKRKPFVLAGFVASAASALALALARTPAQLFFARLLGGIAACSWVTITVLFAAFYPPQAAVRATSLLGFASSTGQMAATFAGGLAAARWGHVAPFLSGALLAAAGLLPMLAVREPAQEPGSIPSLRQILRVLVRPFLLLVSLVAALLQYATFATSYAFVPVYAAERLGLTAAQVGALTSLVLLPYALVSAVVAGLASRFGERELVTLGLAVVALATALVPATHSFSWLLLARLLFGLGSGLTYPVLMGMSIKAVPQQERATAMGAFQAIYALGMTAGPALSGLVSQSLSLPAVFWLTAALSLFGGALLWLPVCAALPQSQAADRT